PDSSPAWSHAGDRVAFVGRLHANDLYQRSFLLVAPVRGGEPVNLSADLDTWVAADSVMDDTAPHLAWSPDDRTLYTTFERGRSLPRRGGRARPAAGEGAPGGPSAPPPPPASPPEATASSSSVPAPSTSPSSTPPPSTAAG